MVKSKQNLASAGIIIGPIRKRNIANGTREFEAGNCKQYRMTLKGGATVPHYHTTIELLMINANRQIDPVRKRDRQPKHGTVHKRRYDKNHLNFFKK